MCISKWLLCTFGKKSEDQKTEELGEGKRQDWFQIVLSIKLSLGLCNLKITLSRVIVFNTKAWQKSMDLHCNERKQKLKARKSTHPSHRQGRPGTTPLCFYYLKRGSFHSTIPRPFLPLSSPALWKISTPAIC